jgi:uncharacterized membrane protein YqjE
MNDLEHGQPTPVAENLRGVTDGISKLVKEHVELAKIELQSSAKRLALDGSMIAAGALLLALGWVLLMFSIGYALGSSIGLGLSFLIIAAVHIIGGGVLAFVFASRLRTKDKPKLENTTIELQRDRSFLNRVGEIIREEPHRTRPV